MRARQNQEFSRKDVANAILNNITREYRPVVDFMHANFQASGSAGLPTSLRVILPAVELASKLEFEKPHELFAILNVPLPEIAWEMFRHGLSHSVVPFKIEKDGIEYDWALTSGQGHHLMGSNTIMIAPEQLLKDLEVYLSKFTEDESSVNIQIRKVL